MDVALNDSVEGVIRSALEQYVTALRKRQHELLVVFTGAKIGCAEAVASLATLRELGYSFKILMSEKAAQVLDVDAIDSALLPSEFWVGQPPVAPEQLARDTDTIVVPTLSASSCAHIVSVMTDTACQQAIMWSLTHGRTVVCAVDGCCPDNAARAELGFTFQPALAKRMRDNRDALRDYGATLTTAARLAKKVVSVQEKSLYARLGLAAPAHDAVQPASSSAATSCATPIPYDGPRVLDASFVRSLSPGTVVAVPSGTLVTQLARDLARTGQVLLTASGKVG